MRTTLNIDDDVLQAAKELAEAQNTTAGEIISSLARSSLEKPTRRRFRRRNGLPLLPGGKLVTTELVDRLANEE